MHVPPEHCARRIVPRVGAVLLTLLAAIASVAQTPERLTGEITGEGFTPIRIAVPQPGSYAAGLDPTELIETIREDLGFSGYFDVLAPKLERLVPPASKAGEVRYDDWLSVGADFVLKIRPGLRDGRIDLEARLHDNNGREMLMGQRYGGSPEILRRVGHQLADDIVRHFTGRPGVALTTLTFVSRRGEGKEVYLMDYDGRRIRRITSTGTINLSPVWSPDGNELAYVSWRGRQPGVYLMSRDGELRSLSTVGGELSSAPDFSPDGQRLVYSSDVDGNSELYVLDRSSGRNRRLTHSSAIETSPSYSPNGREIAFTSDRGGSPQIYVMDAEGLNVRRVSWNGSYNDSPAWSPRGDLLAYSSRIEGRFQIVLLDLSSGRVRQLTSEGNNEDPRWSPDGRHLVFSSNRSGSYDIYTMRSDGSDSRRLTRGRDAYTPDWSR